MKKIWSALSVFAIANLLGLAGFVGWLITSDRLDQPRARQMREMLSETITEERARTEAEQQLAEMEGEGDEDSGGVPLTGSELLEMRLQASEEDRVRVQRLRDEIRQLQTGLSREQRNFEQEREDLRIERESFFQQRAEIERIEGAANFRKAVATLEGLKPKEVRDVLSALISGAGGSIGTVEADAQVLPDEAESADADGTERALAYLNAMQERLRAKVMREFVADDPALAAELLERLRTRGLSARADATNEP